MANPIIGVANNDIKTKLNVKLRRNPFDENGSSFIGSVERNTAKTEALVTRMEQINSGISEYAIEPVVKMLRNTAVSALSQGQATEVLGLGTLYIAPDGAVEGTDAAAVRGFTVKFTPSKLLREVASQIEVADVNVSNSAPKIDHVINVFDSRESSAFTAGKSVRVTGSNLRIGGKGSGIFFVPVNGDAEETPVTEESEWIAVNAEQISVNRPKWLEFFLPDEIVAGKKYRIALRTSYINSAKERKQPYTTYSNVVSVASTESDDKHE